MSLERKITPSEAIAGFEAFHAKSIIKVAQDFLKSTTSPAFDIAMHLTFLTTKEKKELETFTEENFGIYVTSKQISFPHRARDNSWLGIVHYYGISTPINKTTAMCYFEKASEQGDDFGNWGISICSNSPADKMDHLKKVLDKGLMSAYNNLGFEYEKNPEWKDKALECYEKGSQECAVAMYHLGICYQEGELGVTRDWKKAEHYYLLAAERGNPLALHQLGMLYIANKSVGARIITIEFNPVLARLCFEAVVKQVPCSQSLYNLGRIFENGWVGEKNPGRASYYFRLAFATQTSGNQQKVNYVAEKLWSVYQLNKKDAHVCYNAGIGLNQALDAKQRTKTRSAFNALAKRDPHFLDAMSREYNDTIEDIYSVIDIDESDRETMRLGYLVLLKYTELPNEVIFMAFQFIYPISQVVSHISVDEDNARKQIFQEKQKAFAHINRKDRGAHFFNEQANIFKAVKEMKMSHSKALVSLRRL